MSLHANILANQDCWSGSMASHNHLLRWAIWDTNTTQTIELPGLIRTVPSDLHTPGGAVENNCAHWNVSGDIYYTNTVDVVHTTLRIGMETVDAIIACNGYTALVYPGREYLIIDDGVRTVHGTDYYSSASVKLSFTADYVELTLMRKQVSGPSWNASKGCVTATVNLMKDVIQLDRNKRFSVLKATRRQQILWEEPADHYRKSHTVFEPVADETPITVYVYWEKGRFHDAPVEATRYLNEQLFHSVYYSNPDILNAQDDSMAKAINQLADNLQSFKSNMIAYAKDAMEFKSLFKPILQLVATQGKAAFSPKWWAGTYLSWHYGWRLTIKDTAELGEALTGSSVCYVPTRSNVEIPKTNSRWDDITRATKTERIKKTQALLPEEQVEYLLYECTRRSNGNPFAMLNSLYLTAMKVHPQDAFPVSGVAKPAYQDRYGDFTVESHVKAWVSLNPYQQMCSFWNQVMARWDALVSAENVWDLIPFSFVVDWFTSSISDMVEGMESLQVIQAYPIRYTGLSCKVQRKLDASAVFSTAFIGEVSLTRYHRWYRDGSQLNDLAATGFKPDLHLPDKRHLTEGIALLVSLSK